MQLKPNQNYIKQQHKIDLLSVLEKGDKIPCILHGFQFGSTPVLMACFKVAAVYSY